MTNTKNEVVVVDSESQALQRSEPQGGGISLNGAYAAIISGNLDKEKIDSIERLIKMDAEQKYNVAFVKLQGEIPPITATSVIPNRGKYERFEDVMHQISSHLRNNGFSVSFSQDYQENRIIVSCILMHSGGHSRTNSYAVRVSGKADSETQADCKASTTAKRNALLQALNIVIRQDCLTSDDDAHLEGNNNEFVTPEQAFELERRVKESDSSVPAFLEYAKAKKFSEITASKYNELNALLARKERSGK